MVESDLENEKSKITLCFCFVCLCVCLKLKSSISFLGASDSIAGDDRGKNLKVSFGAQLSLVHSQRCLEIATLSHIKETH